MRFPALAFLLLLAFCAIAATRPAQAAEYYVGDAVVKNNLTIQPNYLTGIEMDPMPQGMSMQPGAIHLEVDVHAAKGEPHGFAEKEWIPYVTVTYTLAKISGKFKETGTLSPMTAGDGPHYANNVSMAGPGQYHLTYHFEPPAKAGFVRHVDKATGVPAWWEPFDLEWTFAFPGKQKE